MQWPRQAKATATTEQGLAARGTGTEPPDDLPLPPGMSKEVRWLANYMMLSRGASLEKSAVEEIPDQLRTPAVPQVSQIEPH